MVSSKVTRGGIYQKLNTSSVTSLLAAGSASLYHAVAPPDAAFPFIVYNKQSGVSRWRFGGNAMDSHVWMVKAVDRNSKSGVAEDIAKAVADVLDFKVLSLANGTNLFTARESDLDYEETLGDQQYRHHGALYRVVVQD